MALPYGFIQQIKALKFVEAIYLYGSRARGNERERSDIDIAVYCPLASNSDWLAIEDIIDNADTLLHIDCVRLDTIPNGTRFRKAIERDMKEL